MACGLLLAAGNVARADDDDLFGGIQASKRTFENAVEGFDVSVVPAEAKPGETVTWQFTIKIKKGWHTYPLRQTSHEARAFVSRIEFVDVQDVVPVGQFKEPTPRKVVEEKLKLTLDELEGTVTWQRPMVVLPDAEPGEKKIKAKIFVQVCDEKGCLPKSLQPEVSLKVGGEAVAIDSAYKADVDRYLEERASLSEKPKVEAAPQPSPTEADDKQPTRITAATSEEYRKSLEDIQKRLQFVGDVASSHSTKSGLWAFILSGIFWGAISLVTPCVFPMIPITVSFFLKQSESEHHRPLAMASVYCTTIVVVLTIAAVALLSVFRALSVNPIMNYALGGLFIFFALSLFGMYEIELPGFLTRWTSHREGQGGLVGTMFMALTFTIISFACVAPFLGGFSGTTATATMTWGERILGGLAFSVTFASPFFLLALFPALLKKLPKSGGWLNSVKVVMGFLELAAAFKFFRAAELVLLNKTAYFTYDFVLGIWIALSVLCGLYLLGVYRLPHDSPVENLSVPRLLFAAFFLCIGFYLVPAMFKFDADGETQRPNGVVYAWIDSFLLPEPKEMNWSSDLKQAVDRAMRKLKRTGEKQLVFVDFTGKTCTNCKINEETVFRKAQFKQLFEPYHLVQLYTDVIPDEYYAPSVRRQFDGSIDRQLTDATEGNLEFQKNAFNTEQLPLYVILEPLANGKINVLGIYNEGKINKEQEFAEFLRQPWEDTKVASRE
ncbi:MAG: hypothetical protein KatS3mg105_4237 [Gemmatales bacterium]|nr:MAG: hypothetical protein KatS3mg105_4237 [Gemmatales bacterium]